jgi:hypothetical protein
MPARTGDRARRAAAAAACAALLALTARGQRTDAVADGELAAVTLDVAIAAASHRGRVPAVAWLCERALPAVLPWPRGVDPHGALRLTFAGGRWTVAADAGPGGARDVVAGACRVGDGPAALFACDVDGVEDWFVPIGFAPPRQWSDLLGDLRADRLDAPRSLATAVLVSHLAGGLADGDPRADVLRHGASLCGDATWTAWRTAEHVRVRGRSDGGLLLPAALVALARLSGASANALDLRAYAARDPDRTEAARQLFRAGDGAVAPLRALLHADDATRTAAIDALVRRRATDELPAIVAAAAPDAPWATMAAVDAVQWLWPAASARARQRTRAALLASPCVQLRALDLARHEPMPREAIPPAPGRVRALCALAVVALGLLGVWLRARVLAARAATTATAADPLA